MNWGSPKFGVEGGPMNDEELAKVDTDLGYDYSPEDEKVYSHKKSLLYLVLMEVDGRWNVVHQTPVQEESVERMMELDNECNGNFELRWHYIEVWNHSMEPMVVEDVETGDKL